MTDENRKSLRSFCRDYLWDLFEVMTKDLGCSVDYLINESMRYRPQPQLQHDIRSRSWTSRCTSPRQAEAPGSRRPPPLPRGGEEPMGARRTDTARPALSLLFNGQRFRVEKDKFIIGRGSQLTDLTIRDGNISRKHCAVIYRGGNYFIKDLDSTNGIEFNGKQVERKRIEEGDTFYLYDYELRFTFR